MRQKRYTFLQVYHMITSSVCRTAGVINTIPENELDRDQLSFVVINSEILIDTHTRVSIIYIHTHLYI